MRKVAGSGEPVGVNLHDWIDELCDVLDVETEVDEGLLSDLATIVRANVAPAAAPVTAYLLGVAAAAQDADPETVEALAARAQALAEGWDRPSAAGKDDVDDLDDVVLDDSEIDLSDDEYAI